VHRLFDLLRPAGGIAGLLSVLAVSGSLFAAGAPSDSVRVTYIGNEGFLIEVDSHAVLIDALFREGVSGYASHEPKLRRQLEKAEPPFSSVDVVLATHYHADHFDPSSVGTHLVNNRKAAFISTQQSVSELETSFPAWRHVRSRVIASTPPEGVRAVYEFGPVRVSALNLHHGRDRPVENLGFLIEVGGWTFLHIGDTEVTPDELAAHKLNEEEIDLFFVPYWYLAYSDWDVHMEAVTSDARLVAMHMPPPDDPRGYLEELGGFVGAATKILDEYPTAFVPSEAMQSRWFSGD
jgi:L-ascorbate metabolism protein UlaG (beta-lactamase superfamily)